jgi:hypothetical protein
MHEQDQGNDRLESPVHFVIFFFLGVVMVTSSIISTLAQQDKALITPLKSQILSYLV